MIPHNQVRLTADDKAAVQRVLDSGQIGPGPEVEAFERELAERFRPGGAAACVSSGTAALHLAAMAHDTALWNVPTYACVALFHALANTQSRVFPVDCHPGTLDSPAADVVVHTYGVPCPIADDAIEDFTHAPGAGLGGRSCGSMGTLSVISFGATKPLGCGSGGAVLGPADAIDVIKDVRDYDGKRALQERFNYAWSDIGGAIGRSRLRRLDDENAWRTLVAEKYADVFGNQLGPDGRTWYRYVIRVPNPAAAIAHFATHGVQAINPLEPWELLHRQLGLRPEDFPNAEDAAAHTVSLPIWPGMNDAEVDRVTDALGRLE